MTQNHHADGVFGACPDVDTLADLHAGVLDETTASTLRRHVATCQACAEVLAALDATVASLAAMPKVQIPADVAARLDRAIAAESGRLGLSDDLTASLAAAPPAASSNAQPTSARDLHQAPPQAQQSGSNVSSLDAHRAKRANRGRLLLAAAAVAAVVAGGAVILTQGNDNGPTQADKLTEQSGQAPGSAGPDEVQSFSQPKDVLEKGAIENDKVSPEVAGKMAEQAERNKCLSQIIPRPAYAPEAVQAGTFGGKHAYAFIFPTDDDATIQMSVVDAADCAVVLDKQTGPRE